MTFRRNNFDVTNTVDVTDPVAVAGAVESLFLDVFPKGNVATLRRAMRDVAGLFRGEDAHFAACDTGYHDLQHTLDVTLATARLLDGYERHQKSGVPLGENLFLFGILMALFHDSGYLRRRDAEGDRQGAEFTLVHVARSAALFSHYLTEYGMGELAKSGAQLVHFTGYEVPIDRILVPSPAFRVVGNVVATADMLAQMSDRCYLEKCHDRLYEEFLIGGIARKRDEQGKEEVVFASPQDLVIKTPGFYRGAKRRMDVVLAEAYRYADWHFSGQNLYLETVESNIQFAEYIKANNADIGMLQRAPPQTPGSDHASSEADERRKHVADRRQGPAATEPEFDDRRQIKKDRRGKGAE